MIENTAFVQCRMGSSRLPNKMMLWLHGYPVIDWVRLRLLKSKLIGNIVFATSESEKDDILADYLKSKDAHVFRGSETDVLKRFADCLDTNPSVNVIRICADNPLLSPVEVDRLISFFQENQYDYVYNHIPRDNKYPDGFGAEIVSAELLNSINQKAELESQREHIFNYIWEHREEYRIATFNPPEEIAYPEAKLDLDTLDDYMKLLKMDVSVDSNDSDIIKAWKDMNSEI